MKTLILAGGLGTRLSEETDYKPKPMIEIGGKPILWHIMKIYSSFGFNEFIILVGYKSYLIKEYFYNYFLHQSSLTINLQTNEMKVHSTSSEPWIVTVLETGLDTMTGGRILRAKEFIGDETFMMTYGDGIADVNLKKLLDFHKSNNSSITMTAVQQEGRFGALNITLENRVSNFIEKPRGDGSWINGGFFVCQPEIFDYIKNGDNTTFEYEPLQSLANDGKLLAYKHDGFWRCMDTQRDKYQLEDLWKNNKAKWKIWD